MTGLDRRAVIRRVQAHERARAETVARVRGDHDHGHEDGHDTVLRPDPPLKRAAVLVPIVDRSDGLTVLLTKRTDHLSSHAGQIAFPGGRIEPEDPDPEHAALRETAEEIGLPSTQVELIGRLDLYHTSTGFEIVPVVGLVTPPLALVPAPDEVAAVFEVPLSFVVDPANHTRQSRDWRGGRRSYYVLPYDDWHIWGATAGMLVNLADVLTRP